MKKPLLDVRTRVGLNSLDKETVEHYSPYFHEVVWYGISSLAHCVIMGKAREVASKAVPLEEFIDKYQIAFNPLSASLRAVMDSRIFIPNHAFECFPHKNNSGRVLLFDDDLLNRCLVDYTTHSKQSGEKSLTELTALTALSKLIISESDLWDSMAKNQTYQYREDLSSAIDIIYNHKWTKHDFHNPGLVEKGVNVGKYFYRIAKEGFVVAVAKESMKPEHLRQPDNVTTLARNLIAYYDEVIRGV